MFRVGSDDPVGPSRLMDKKKSASHLKALLLSGGPCPCHTARSGALQAQVQQK